MDTNNEDLILIPHAVPRRYTVDQILNFIDNYMNIAPASSSSSAPNDPPQLAPVFQSFQMSIPHPDS